MTRQMFVKVAATAIRQNPGLAPEQIAEAIATLMDTFAQVLGESAHTPAPPPAQPPRTAFPAPNPEAVALAPPPPEPEYVEPLYVEEQAAPEEAPRIILDTTMPPPSERATGRSSVLASDIPPRSAGYEPLRSLRAAAAGRMKVEQLSELLQQRAPMNLKFDVPVGDGQVSRVVFARNVVSMHAHDSVQLIYFPPNASASLRESASVQAVIHLDDVPLLDLSAIIKKLTLQAIESIRPRGPIVSVTPPATRGPVQPAQDYPDGSPSAQDRTSEAQNQAIFHSVS